MHDYISNISLAQIKDIITILGTICVVVIGFLGLNTWHRQLHGTSRYETAKKLLLTSYQVKSCIETVRNPIIFYAKKSYAIESKDMAEKKAYSERLDNLTDKYNELKTIRLEAEVIWGKPAIECTYELADLVQELSVEIGQYFWLKGTLAVKGAKVDNNPERVAKNEKIVFRSSTDDEFSKRINNAISKIEQFYKKKLHSETKFF